MLTTIFIILLILSQLFCFYIIALLNAKVAKFKDLEGRQNQMIREMEESISLYLVEIREENDRLIKELSKDISQKTEAKIVELSFDKAGQQLDDKGTIESGDTAMEPKMYVPKTVAHHAYNKSKQQLHIDNLNSESKSEAKTVEKTETLSFEQQVLNWHDEGKNVEEIAKMTNKGKTEIELLLKFNA
jgi:hypothetical protein